MSKKKKLFRLGTKKEFIAGILSALMGASLIDAILSLTGWTNAPVYVRLPFALIYSIILYTRVFIPLVSDISKIKSNTKLKAEYNKI